ncbi:MAG TPA: PEGA domain-containing protein [Polyangia bacterium]
MRRFFLVCALVLVGGGQAAAQAGSVDVRSDPAGAAIAVDGTARGVAPNLVATGPGKHIVTLTLEGYIPERHEIVVARGRTKLYVRLSRAGAGGISVRDEVDGKPRDGLGLVVVVTEPPGLTVLMNDQKVARPTPVAFDIAPGTYTTVLQHRGAEVLTTRTTVQAGWKVELRRTLTKQVRAVEKSAGREAPPAAAGRSPEKCGCMPPKKLKSCVEQRRVCAYHPEGRGAGYAVCTRCPKLKRLPRRRQADAALACDTREGRAGDCVCADIGRVLMHCLEPETECLKRCRGQ